MKLTLKLFICVLFMQSCRSKDNVEDAQIPKKPNVLFVLVDDLGLKDLSYTGSTFYETPNIDALAVKSFNFTQGYAGSRVCSPSRATIMTGKFTARHGITDWIGAKTNEDWRKLNREDKLLPASYVHDLLKEETTLAETLKANGYKTFFAGKWHLGNSFPTNHGFDINKGGWDKGSPKGGYFSPFKNPKLKDRVKGENLTQRLADETLDFIEHYKDSSFFAFLSFYAVHGPIQTSENKWGKYRTKAESQGIKGNGFAMESKLPIRAIQDNPIYAGLVESMDDAVGIVVNGLKDLGLEDNTIVIFTSDNGGVASGDAFSTSNLPYKGGKGYQWEGGIKAPYFIYVPWENIENKTIDYPVTGADFYPTILDYANIDLLKNQHQDGMSLKPIISKTRVLPERPLYWHYPHYGNQGGDPSSIIREGKWKLIHYYETETNQLYDLEADPYEKKDLASTHSEIVIILSAKLKTWLNDVNAAFPKTDTNFNAEKRQTYDNKINNKLLPKLEKQRKAMLTEGFKPNKDWWGSKTTKD